MMLFLSADDVRRALPMSDAVECMKRAFAELLEDGPVVPPRTHVPISEYHGDALFMPAYSAEQACIGVKVITLFEGNRAQGLPFIQAVVLLFDAHTGRPTALLDGSALTAIRTGAVCGAATDLLARPDASTATIFGAGVQARTQLEAVHAVRPIRRANIVDPDRERAEQLARDMGDSLGIRVEAVADSATALRQADIVCTATTATTPVFDDVELPDGTHINAVGSYKPHVREIPSATVARARVVVDQRSMAWEEAGDLIMPVEEGVITRHHVWAELGQIVTGAKSARQSPDEVTLFKSVGIALQDIAAGQLALNNARLQGLGTPL